MNRQLPKTLTNQLYTMKFSLKGIKKIVLFLTFFFPVSLALAQESAPVEMATELRSSGKIYVVVAVLLLIFIGIVIYLVRLDKKISKLEKELKK